MKYVRVGCLVVIVLLLFAGVVAAWLWFYDAGLNRDFDPEVVAASETRMWQAYYTGNKEALGLELVTLMREQFGLSYGTAVELMYVLGKATMTFGAARGDYEAAVLPGLITFYTRVAEISGGTWDPEMAARAELAWWVARRTPGEDSAEQVGAKIAALYTIIYGSTNPEIERAGLLRAQAAVLRDEGKKNADWVAIEGILVESYTALRAGVIP